MAHEQGEASFGASPFSLAGGLFRRRELGARLGRLVLRNLGDQFAQDRIGECIVAFHGDYERAWSADDAFPKILIEIRLDGQDGKAVDADAGSYGFIACLLRRPADVIRSVAGNIDDPLICSVRTRP